MARDLRLCFVGDSFVNGTGDDDPTLMVGPPPFAGDPLHDARVAALSAALGRLCAELGVPFLDLHGPLSDDASWRAEVLAGDGVHPNNQGYERIAALVEAWEPWQAWTGAGNPNGRRGTGTAPRRPG